MLPDYDLKCIFPKKSVKMTDPSALTAQTGDEFDIHLKGSDSMCKLFDDWSKEIKQFCDDNGYDFEAAKQLCQSWNSNTVVLYHCANIIDSDGLLNDTPSPMVLLIRRETDGSLVFETTQHTEKFLKKVL